MLKTSVLLSVAGVLVLAGGAAAAFWCSRGKATATTDTTGKGWEAELTANPLPNWRISLNAVKVLGWIQVCLGLVERHCGTDARVARAVGDLAREQVIVRIDPVGQAAVDDRQLEAVDAREHRHRLDVAPERQPRALRPWKRM